MGIRIKKTDFWLGLLFVVLSIPLSKNEYFYYYAIGLLFLFGLYFNGLRAKIDSFIDKIPLLMICIWLYGVLIGLINGNPDLFIIRNFAGTACYLLYYAIPRTNYFKNNNNKLLITIISASVVSTLILFLSSFLYKNVGAANVWPLSNVDFNFYTESVSSPVGVLGFVLESVSLYKFWEEDKYLKKLLWLILFSASSYCLIIANTMGGFFLGYLTVLWFSIIAVLIRKGKAHKTSIFVFFIIVSIMFIIHDYVNEGFIYEIFSTSDAGNSKRFYQLSLIFDRLTLFGNGIGAPIQYYFGSRYFDGYNVEISYLNCIDKYGIMSLPLFYLFFQSLLLPLKNIWYQRGDNLVSLLAIALLGYLCVALGNPVLFAPYNVMLHCFSLYLLSSTSINLKR